MSNELELFDGHQDGLGISDDVKEKPAINITDKDGRQTVSARELYEKLYVNERFSKWWERFSSYGFEENIDFIRGCTKKYTPSNQFGGVQEVELQDYQITIEMAKQICMLQRSEKGRLYREYFLKIEKAWNTPEAVMARALQVANRTLEDIQKRLNESESVVNRIASGKGCFSMSQTAKALKLPYGRTKLFEKLRGLGLLDGNNTPMQEQVNSGHFKVVVKYVNEQVGNKAVTLTTGKGLVYLAKKFNTEIDESIKADA